MKNLGFFSSIIIFVFIVIIPCSAFIKLRSANTAVPDEQLPDSSPKVIILADMGNEPDEEQQMIHMLMCSNEFELRGLIAVTGWWLKSGPRPDLFFKLIDGYKKVYSNLQLHAQNYPTPQHLESITKAGQGQYGIEAVGEKKSSEGSELIEAVLLENDSRPIWIVVNAGSNTLAQALFDLNKKLSDLEMNNVIQKIRVYENGAQDNAGAWICHNFPGIHWIRSNYQTYAYGGPRNTLGPNYWKPYQANAKGQHEWLKENVQTNHGPLGELYPDRYFEEHGFICMEGGGTTPWIGLVNKGLFNIHEPSWGGWGGRFTRKKVPDQFSKYYNFVRPDELNNVPFYMYTEVSDTWQDPSSGIWYTNDNAPVWRWREAMYNDFTCRMDWCVKSFAEANHHPVAVIDDDKSDKFIYLDVLAGQQVQLSGQNSYDPDGDSLQYNWWQYQEAGTYSGKVLIKNTSKNSVAFTVPSGAYDSSIHIVLEVKDDNPLGKLYDYRRVVLNVLPSNGKYLRE